MKVLKFGGSSIATVADCKRVCEIIRQNYDKGKQIVVVSAFGGVTDEFEKCICLASKRSQEYKHVLLELKNRHFAMSRELGVLEAIADWSDQKFKELDDLLQGVYLLEEISEKVKNTVMGAGELLSSRILTAFFIKSDMEVAYYDSRDYIKTQSGGIYLNSKQTYQNLEPLKQADFNLAVFPGFVASGSNGEPGLLGRGGSDYTASILAAGLQCSELEIWTDVSGMYTADPNLVSQAIPIEQMSFQEAMELSHFGAKVIYPPTLIPVVQNKINVRIKNTFSPEDRGTLITSFPSEKRSVVRGLSSVEHIHLLTLSGNGVIGISGFASRFFTCLAQAKVNVVLITQASSEHSISVGIYKDDKQQAIEAVQSEFKMEIQMNMVNEPAVEENLSIVAVVGEDMGSTPGISGKVFSALGRNGVNIRATAQGGNEMNLTFMVRTSDVKKTLNVIHEEFFLSASKKINLYVAGVGNVGSKLLEFIQKQYDFLVKEKGIQLIVRGITNSRRMYFASNENLLDCWEQKLNEEGEKANLQAFVEQMNKHNLRNSIFIDVTASKEVSEIYPQVLKSSVSIVACNKIAASSDFERYLEIKTTAKKHNVEFMFESNVGAGLPIISTIENLIHTGDEIVEIEAVVSGSLNFIMNEFCEGKTFSEAVKLAMKQGFTEPDPKIDLSGMDVVRKLLILTREAGYPLQEKEVQNESMVPKSCLKGKTAEDLIKDLEASNEYFESWRKRMQEEGIRFRYVASFTNGKAQVGLREVKPGHSFYSIQGKDNVISLRTKWYHDQPLIVKGAGAGAEVTACGIFGDIIKISSK